MSGKATPARVIRVNASERAELGAFLAAARVEAGVTQRRLEATSGVSQGKISRMERGTSRPLLAEIAEVCAALGLEVVLEIRYPESGEAAPDPAALGGRPHAREVPAT